MKSKITNMTAAREFAPIKVEIELETIEEARLLYHVVNRGNLLDALSGSRSYMFTEYHKDIASNFDTDLGVLLKQEFENRGYPV